MPARWWWSGSFRVTLAVASVVLVLFGSAVAQAQQGEAAARVVGLDVAPERPSLGPGEVATFTVRALTSNGGSFVPAGSACVWSHERSAGGLEPVEGNGCKATYTAPVELVADDALHVTVTLGDRILRSEVLVDLAEPAPVPVPAEACGSDARVSPTAFTCPGGTLVLLGDASGSVAGVEVRRLPGLPEGTPAPPSSVALERVVDLTPRDADGLPVHDVRARVLVHVSPSWLGDACALPTCRPTLFHLGDDGWEALDTQPLPGTSKRTLAATTDGFSLYAVGGRVQPVGMADLPWGWLLGGLVAVGVVGSGTGLWLKRQSGNDGEVSVVAEPSPESGSGSGQAPVEETRAEELVESLRDQDLYTFVSSLTHDLSNAVGPIALNLQRLLATDLEDLSTEQREALNLLDRNVDHVDRLIFDLREAARLRFDEFVLDRQILDLNDVVQEAVSTYRGTVEEAGVGVEVRVTRSTMNVYADRDRLLQVMHNVLKNALEACQQGDEITVILARRDEEAQVLVQDTGRGFDPDMRGALFEAFQRLPGRRDGGGSGLGLYVSRVLVERHGGWIWATSEGEGRGACITIALPRWGV